MAHVPVGGVDDDFVAEILQPDGGVDDEALGATNAEVGMEEDDSLWGIRRFGHCGLKKQRSGMRRAPNDVLGGVGAARQTPGCKVVCYVT